MSRRHGREYDHDPYLHERLLATSRWYRATHRFGAAATSIGCLALLLAALIVVVGTAICATGACG